MSASNLGQFKVMQSANNISCPSHYADGIPIFGKACNANIEVIQSIARYRQLSGQQVNWQKSKVFFGPLVSSARTTRFLQRHGMKKGSFPFNYLGVLWAFYQNSV